MTSKGMGLTFAVDGRISALRTGSEQRPQAGTARADHPVGIHVLMGPNIDPRSLATSSAEKHGGDEHGNG
jgi:hypothetical protein